MENLVQYGAALQGTGLFGEGKPALEKRPGGTLPAGSTATKDAEVMAHSRFCRAARTKTMS